MDLVYGNMRLTSEVLITFSDAGICTNRADPITIQGVIFDSGAAPTAVLGKS